MLNLLNTSLQDAVAAMGLSNGTVVVLPSMHPPLFEANTVSCVPGVPPSFGTLHPARTSVRRCGHSCRSFKVNFSSVEYPGLDEIVARLVDRLLRLLSTGNHCRLSSSRTSYFPVHSYSGEVDAKSRKGTSRNHSAWCVCAVLSPSKYRPCWSKGLLQASPPAVGPQPRSLKWVPISEWSGQLVGLRKSIGLASVQCFDVKVISNTSLPPSRGVSPRGTDRF